jgi:hypothetical protein
MSSKNGINGEVSRCVKMLPNLPVLGRYIYVSICVVLDYLDDSFTRSLTYFLATDRLHDV